MNLLLEKKYEEEFYIWLLDKIKKLFPLFIKKYRLIKLSQYLNIDCYNVLLIASKHFILKDFRDNKIITVNNTIKYGQFLLKDLCNFINDGNVDIKGSNIFTDFFSVVKENIDTYYFLYKEGI